MNVTDPRPDIVSQIIERAASPGYEAWWSRVEDAGFCSSPVELRGRSADGKPITILARCKNRRASVCPSCSALYSGDTWQLVHQGIADGVDADGGRPMVFTTLTAPSFGAVHSSARSGGRCRPGTAASYAHGRSLRCGVVHRADDPRLGEPLCAECYDYLGHVLFTWHAPQLWHRFTVTLRRSVDQRSSDAQVSYVKVVELQRRGVPHFHAVIRLDDPSPAIPLPNSRLSFIERRRRFDSKCPASAANSSPCDSARRPTSSRCGSSLAWTTTDESRATSLSTSPSRSRNSA